MKHAHLATKVVLTLLMAASSSAQDLRDEAGAALEAHHAAVLAEEAAEALLAELQAAVDAQAGVLAQAREDRQLAAVYAAHTLKAWLDDLDGPGDLGGPGPGSKRPGEDLDWHVRPRPADGDLDWIAAEGVLTSRRGLGTTELWGDAYRRSRASGDEDIVFGVMDDHPVKGMVGGHYRAGGPNSLDYPGDADASATFVGLTDTASVVMGFASHFQNVQPTGEVSFFDIGLRSGGPDSHLGRATGGCRHIQFDGCWWLHWDRKFDYTQLGFNHGMSITDWDTLVFRNHKWRGETPGSPGMRLLYYPLYLHEGSKSTLIENNDLRGGGRGGFQIRPDGRNDIHPTPTARIMVRGNHYTSCGAGGDGGGIANIWNSFSGLYVYDNDFQDFPFLALLVSGQSKAQCYDVLESGNQHRDVYIAGNRFIPGPNSKRATCSISSVDRLHLWGDNTLEGPVILDAQWNNEKNGTLNGATTIHASERPPWNLRKFDRAIGQERVFTTAEVKALLSNR